MANCNTNPDSVPYILNDINLSARQKGNDGIITTNHITPSINMSFLALIFPLTNIKYNNASNDKKKDK